MRESKVEKHLTESVEALGGQCVKFPPLFYAGFPDRLVFLPRGVFVLVETKAPRKTPSLLQRNIHTRMRALGFRVEELDIIELVDTFILTL
jgi:hypothetical protein